MSTININQASTLLISASAVVHQLYAPEMMDLSYRTGSVTNRLIKPADKVASGDGINVAVMKWAADNARASRDPMGDFGDTDTAAFASVKIRYSNSDPSANDFTTVNASAIISDDEVTRRANDGSSNAAVDIAKLAVKQMMQNLEDVPALLTHMPASGRLALINGTKVNSGTYTYASGSAYTNGSTTARFKVDTGSIGSLREGMLIDAYTSAGVLNAEKMRIVRKNEEDSSISVTIVGTGSTTTNLDNLTDNDELFRSTERNKGARSSLREFFAVASSGDSWVGGKDRTTDAYAFLQPRFARVGASTASISRTILDNALSMMHNRFEIGTDKQGREYTFLGSVNLAQTLLRDISSAAVVQQAGVNNGQYTLGAAGVSYIHPWLGGRLSIVGDPVAPDYEACVIVPATWSRYAYQTKGPRMMPGTMGNWYRPQGSSAVSGDSKFWRMDGYYTYADWCSEPDVQVGIKALQP